MTNKKQRAAALNHLSTYLNEAMAKKRPKGRLVEAIAKTVCAMPLNEQDLALDILRAIPGIGDMLADLQARNGYDFDAKAGNQFRGHAGFPSTPDDSTYSDR